MSRRWCIIAGPRSGSTWFETMIYKKIKSIDSRMEVLEEVINPSVNLHIKMDQFGNLKKIGVTTDNLKTVSELINDRCKMFLSARDDQPLVMRIFPNEIVYSDSNFQNLLNIIKQKNFKFIFLNRNIFDRCISIYFMIETHVIHRLDGIYRMKDPIKNEFRFEKSMLRLDKTRVNVDQFRSILLTEYATNKNIKKLAKEIEHCAVDYENIIEDCQKFNIPIDTDVIIKKTYDDEYQSIIENYQELLEIYNEFEIGNV